MGSITSYATADGKRYRVRYRKPDHSQTDKRGFKTKREAELFLAATEVSKARGEFIDSSSSKIPVGELGKLWLPSQTHLKPSSFEPLEIAWRLYVEPRWGSTPISDIRFSDVQTWVSQLTQGTAVTRHTKAGPRSATVVLRCYGVLAAILDTAVRDRRILRQPCSRRLAPPQSEACAHLPHPRAGRAAREVLRAARDARASALPTRDFDGARQSHFACATWIPFVVDSASRENATRVNGKIIVGTPKNHSARVVPFPDFLTLELARACEGKGQNGLLFGNGVDHLKQPAHGDGWFEVAIGRAKDLDPTFTRLTPHDLRHTAASLAVSAGGNVKAIQRMLGHSSAAMTLDVYADLFDDDLDTLASALDAARRQSGADPRAVAARNSVTSELRASTS